MRLAEVIGGKHRAEADSFLEGVRGVGTSAYALGYAPAELPQLPDDPPTTTRPDWDGPARLLRVVSSDHGHHGGSRPLGAGRE